MTELAIRTNPGVRLTPPSRLTDQRWSADDLVHRRRFTLAAPAAAALIYCMSPRPRHAVVEFLTGAVPEAAAHQTVSGLMHERLVLDPAGAAEPSVARFAALAHRWEKANWRLAADYHLATWDYPCLDYSDRSRPCLEVGGGFDQGC
jgi:hypothetical protein